MAEQQQQPKQVQIRVPDDVLRGRYANFVRVNTNSPEEFMMDFGIVSAADGVGVVTDRVIMSPGHVKRLMGVLQNVMREYEGKHGSVTTAHDAAAGEIGFKVS